MSERALAEKADDDAILLQVFRRERRAGGERRAAADDGVGAEIAGVRIGDMHRSAFALAVAGFLPEQLGEHQIRRGALCETVTVTAVRAGNVVVPSQRVADAHGHRFFADVEVREPGHQRARV